MIVNEDHPVQQFKLIIFSVLIIICLKLKIPSDQTIIGLPI